MYVNNQRTATINQEPDYTQLLKVNDLKYEMIGVICLPTISIFKINKMKKGELLYVPCNLDDESLDILLSLDSEYKESNKFRVLKTLSYIIQQISESDRKDYKTEFVPIKMEYIRKYIPNAEIYIRTLMKIGIVESDNKYIIGEKSKGYRLLAPFNSTPKIIILGESDEAKINQKVSIESFDNDSKKLKPLYKSFNPKLCIDYPSVIKEGFIEYWQHDGEGLPIFIDDIIFDRPDSFELIKHCNEFDNAHHRDSYHKLINGTMIPGSLLHSKQFFFKVDKQGYRLHTNLTNLRKDLRKHIKYDEERLVAWDLKNSQPFFLNVLLNPSFWDYKNKAQLNFRELNGELKSLKELKERGIDPSITMLKIKKISSEHGFQEFKNVTLQGNLYEFLQEMSYEFFDMVISREKAKNEFIRILFDKAMSVRKYHYDTEDAFALCFPGLLEFLDKTFKSVKHNTLALLLQQIESNVILRVVCPAIAKKYPKIPLFTVHDSIVTSEGNEELIKPIIEEEIRRVTGGLTPILKLEKWF